jgi:hypothetical protein
MMARRRGRGGGNQGPVQFPKKFVDSLIIEGVNELAKKRPTFRNSKDYLARHVDRSAVEAHMQFLYQHAQTANMPDDQATKYIRDGVVDYISNDGGGLDDTGREVILRKSLEAKAGQGFFKGMFKGRRGARKTLASSKYLDKVAGAFGEMHTLLASGMYTENMGTLARDIETVYTLGFMDAALDIMRSDGILDEGKYKVIKRNIDEATRKKYTHVVGSMEEYTQKMAASIMATLGLVFIAFFGFSMTGNVIGDATTPLQDIFGIGVGVVFIILSLMSFTRIRKAKKLLRFRRKR